MVLAGQAVLGGVGQHAAQHSAQRVARQHVVSDVIGRHGRSCRIQMPADRRDRSPDSPFCHMLPRRRPRSAGVSAVEFAAADCRAGQNRRQKLK